MIVRKIALALVLSALGAWGSAAADFPHKPIRFVVASTPGGAPDLSGRVLAEKLSLRFRQPVIVENRPGAGEIVALNALDGAEPDGHTLAFFSSSIMALQALNKAFRFNFSKDFTPLSPVVYGDNVVIVSSKSPNRTLEQLISSMRENPGKINVGITGGYTKFQAEMFRVLTGTKFETVSYTGSPQAVQAVISGEVDARLGATISTVKPLADAGRLRLLAVNAPRRSYFLPEVPALSESAMPELQELARSNLYSGFWFAPLAPTGTPREIIGVLSAAMGEITKDPDFVKRMHDIGLEAPAAYPSSEEFRALLVRESAMAIRIAVQGGIKPE